MGIRSRSVRRFVAVGAVTTTAAFGFLPASHAASSHGSGGASETQFCSLGSTGLDPDFVTFSGPSFKLWPPNHKMVDFTLLASESQGEQKSGKGVKISATVTEIGEPTLGAGGPQHDSDVAVTPSTDPTGFSGSNSGNDGTASLTISLRAERSGLDSAGRQYRVDWMASFDSSDTRTCNSMDNQSANADGSTTNGNLHHAFVVTVPPDMGH